MNKFNEISHRPLRIYNRAVMALNIMNDVGPGGVEGYAEIFPPKERKEMADMVGLITLKGHKYVKQLVTKDCAFLEDKEVVNE